jgi:hypothetical protein
VAPRARRGDSAAEAHRLLEELARALSRTGRPPVDGITLTRLEHRFRADPGAASYLHALRLARYGGRVELPTAPERRALRAALAEGLGFPGRLRALWALPPRGPRLPRLGRIFRLWDGNSGPHSRRGRDRLSH